MKLETFDKIKNGMKIIEFRLYMDAYYFREKRTKYDVVGIEIEAFNL